MYMYIYVPGALSGARESWEYDSGARDLQSPDLHNRSTLRKLLQYEGSSMNQQVALQRLFSQVSNISTSVGGSYLELANTVSILFSSCAYVKLIF